MNRMTNWIAVNENTDISEVALDFNKSDVTSDISVYYLDKEKSFSNNKDFFNQSGMAVLCPIVRFAEEDALHFPFQTKELQGVILAEQMKSMDLSVRYYQTVSSLSIAQLQDVCDAVQDIFAYYPYSVL